MKKTFYSIFISVLLLFACTDNTHQIESDKPANDIELAESEVHLTPRQFEIMKMQIDTISERLMGSYVQVNGRLEVSPQNEASVTAIVGANITAIHVIEGDKVKKGQVLAKLSHPNLIVLQTNYISKYHELEFLEQDYNRQKHLFEENIGSGKEFQKIKADYLSAKGLVKGYEAQFRQMGLNTSHLQKGNIYDEIPVFSPISGSVNLVNIKMGQFVQPEMELFEIIDIDDLHADFMVFEKDIHKVRNNQEIRFKVDALADREYSARIFSIGSSFEKSPKALHIHADIIGDADQLLPGMYARGRIYTDEKRLPALPDDAVVREGNSYFIFTAHKLETEKTNEWIFKPMEVKIGMADNGFKEIIFLKEIPPKTLFAYNNAYYLYSEMMKGHFAHED